MKNETRLTSVKINIEVQNKFKHVCLDDLEFKNKVDTAGLYLIKK